jgi:hypothetical protein
MMDKRPCDPGPIPPPPPQNVRTLVFTNLILILQLDITFAGWTVGPLGVALPQTRNVTLHH